MKKTRVMEEEFKCAICLNMFEMPVSIPCGHTFCFWCLAQLYDKNKEDCPLCKEHHGLWNFNPQLMKVNTLIQNTMNHLFPDLPKPLSERASSYNRRIKKEEYHTAKKLLELAENLRPFFKLFGRVEDDIVVENDDFIVNKMDKGETTNQYYPVMIYKKIVMIDLDSTYIGRGEVTTADDKMKSPNMKAFLENNEHMVYKSSRQAKHIFLLDWEIDWSNKKILIDQFQRLMDVGCDKKYLLCAAINKGFAVRLGAKKEKVPNGGDQPFNPNDSDTYTVSTIDSFYERERDADLILSKRQRRNRDLILKHMAYHELYRNNYSAWIDELYYPSHMFEYSIKGKMKKFAID